MAHPFRKMTTRQLRRLLKDDRERNRILTEPPDRSDTRPTRYPINKNQTDPSPNHTKNIHLIPVSPQPESITHKQDYCRDKCVSRIKPYGGILQCRN